MLTYRQRQQQSPARSGNRARAGSPAVRSRHLHGIPQSQRTLGNQAVQRLLQSKRRDSEVGPGAAARASLGLDFLATAAPNPPTSIQKKLTASTTADVYEREADHVADQVMRMPAPELQRSCACGGGCSDCGNKLGQSVQNKEQIQAQRVGSNENADDVAPPIVHEVLQSPGRPLDANTRSFMEPRFGYDFSGVRIHSDDAAAKSAKAVNAKAYTVGRHIALGEGQYAPQTLEGKRLLAHELTHVVHQTGGSGSVPALQRQAEGKAKPAKNYPFSVTFSGCDTPPHNKDVIEEAIKTAFTTVRDSDCIKNQSLKDEILSKYNGLKIVCTQDDLPGTCAEVTSPFSQTMKVFASAHKGDCVGLLEVVILHESVHFTQWSPFAHGDLSWDCQEACFPGRDKHKRGVASRCLNENTLLPFVGVSTGKAYLGTGASASYLRLYAGLEKRGPILSLIHPSFGLGLSFIGKPTGGEPSDIPTSSSTLLSLMGALRFDPAALGGGYVSLSTGLEVGERNDKLRVGYEVGAALGYRWYVFDVSLDAGIEYDPTQIPGAQKMYILGASLKIAPKIRR